MKVGFIGTGNMGGALAHAAAQSPAPAELLLSNRTPEKAQALAQQLGATVSDNETIAQTCDYIFLGVKPQMMADLLARLRPILSRRQEGFVLVSMAAGLTLQRLGEMAGLSCPILRIMPNTACAVGDQPEHPFSTCNHGKGFYTDFGKAGNYIFGGTTVKVKDTRKQDRGVIYELEFYDRKQNMEETMMDRKMVNFLREQYPPGTRIRLNAMDDPHHPILPGTEGEVDFVDDEGQIFMKWDNGRTLPLIPGEDSFTVLPPKLTTLKLYMPLTADLYERNEYGEFDDSSTLLEGSELRGYQDQITAALVKNRMPEEAERGLMHWYDEADSVDRKVRSAVFTVEERDRQLWGVAECRVAGELSDTALETLKEYLTGQASDGWGEGFEQREISVDDGGELYVHFWNSDEWSIQTEQERFEPRLSEGYTTEQRMGGL